MPKKTESPSPKALKGKSILKSNQYIIQRPDGSCTVMTTQGPGSVMTSAGEAVKIFPLTLPSATRAVVSKSENVISIAGQPAVSIKIDGNKIPLSMVSTHSGPITTNLTKSPTSPVKYIKLISTPEIASAVKLKSANVYEKMLQDDKLVHLYKCMGRDCSFSTSVEPSFQKHLKLHEDDLVKVDGPKDYLKCAYCYNDCASYKDLLAHLKSNHTFCRYCCKYCFYRSFAQSYVELHQVGFFLLVLRCDFIRILWNEHFFVFFLENQTPDEENTNSHGERGTGALAADLEETRSKSYHQALCLRTRYVDIRDYIQYESCKFDIDEFTFFSDCNKYFFIPEAFTLHLNMHHLTLKNTKAYRCHVCKDILNSVDDLIAVSF